MLAGSGKASAATRSNSPWPATASSSRAVVVSIVGTMAVTRFMLNARAVGLRSRACSGSSKLTIDGCGWGPAPSRILWGSGVVGPHRGLAHRGGVAGRVAEHRRDVVVAGQHVVADGRGEKDRLLPVRQPGQDRVRVGEVLRRQRVKGLIDGTAHTVHHGLSNVRAGG